MKIRALGTGCRRPVAGGARCAFERLLTGPDLRAPPSQLIVISAIRRRRSRDAKQSTVADFNPFSLATRAPEEHSPEPTGASGSAPVLVGRGGGVARAAERSAAPPRSSPAAGPKPFRCTRCAAAFAPWNWPTSEPPLIRSEPESVAAKQTDSIRATLDCFDTQIDLAN